MSKQKAVHSLDAHAIRTYYAAFHAQSPLSELVVLDQVDSTMHYLQNHYPDSHMVAVISDHQTAGVGSYGRAWSSPPGVGIWLSISWRFHTAPCPLTSLRIGYAVWEAIAPYCPTAPQLKWPNDIYYNTQKLAGIRIDQHTAQQVVIGIGLNVFPHAHSNAPSALALATISTQGLCRNRLTAELLWRCQWQLHQAADMDILSAWHQHDALTNTRLTLTSAGKTYNGAYHGIDSQGALCIKQGTQLQVFTQAHITKIVRKTP